MDARDPELRTDRLLLRRWRDADRAPFAVINGDPRVMEHFPAPLTRTQSDEFVKAAERGFAVDGFGLWAVEILEVGDDQDPPPGVCIGFVGLARVNFTADFTPAVEVGWRLATSAWGRGYATEAGRGALQFGFAEAGLTEIVSFTSTTNSASEAVMRRIGMRAAGTFEHPRLRRGHPLRTHVLYRIDSSDWSRRC